MQITQQSFWIQLTRRFCGWTRFCVCCVAKPCRGRYKYYSYESKATGNATNNNWKRTEMPFSLYVNALQFLFSNLWNKETLISSIWAQFLHKSRRFRKPQKPIILVGEQKSLKLRKQVFRMRSMVQYEFFSLVRGAVRLHPIKTLWKIRQLNRYSAAV